MAVAIACWWSPYNQPGFWRLRAAPGQNGRFAAFGIRGGRLGARLRPYPVRPTPWAYDGAPASHYDPSETSTAHCSRASDDGLPTLRPWPWLRPCRKSPSAFRADPMPPSSPYDPWPAARRRPCRRRSGSCQRIHQVDECVFVAVFKFARFDRLHSLSRPSHHSNAPMKTESQSILSKIIAHFPQSLKAHRSSGIRADNGLKSDIAPCPKSAKERTSLGTNAM